MVTPSTGQQPSLGGPTPEGLLPPPPGVEYPEPLHFALNAPLQKTLDTHPLRPTDVCVRAVIFASAGESLQEPSVLLVQRAATDSLPLKWEFPGGGVDPGESLLQALVREVREETGLGVERVVGGLPVPMDEEGGTFYIRARNGREVRTLVVHHVVSVKTLPEQVVCVRDAEHCAYRWVRKGEEEGMELTPGAGKVFAAAWKWWDGIVNERMDGLANGFIPSNDFGGTEKADMGPN